MLPIVSQITSLDVYRDGGSLSVSFKSAAPEVDYTLLFPIDLSPAFDPCVKNSTFKQPVLEVYRSAPYVSPVTGISTPSFTKETTPVGWEEARTLLSAIRQYIFGFDSEYSWVYEAMVLAASSDGKPC